MGFLEELRAGKVSEDIRELAAENAIPLPPREQFEVLALLLKDPVSSIADKAFSTLVSLPASTINSYISSREANPELLHLYAQWALEEKNYSLLDSIIRNPKVKDETLILLAEKGDAKVTELVADNQVRAMSSPKIINALVKNPATPVRVRALMEEWKRLYYDPQTEKAVEAVEEMLEELEELEEGEDLEDIEEIEELLESSELDDKNIYTLTWNEIKNLPVPAKVRLALMGSKMHRAILIRDNNKIVVEAVLESPKLTENEIAIYSKMKSLPQEVIRKIASSRDWTKHYSVILNLVKNPKTPLPIAMGFLSRLRGRDLREISRSREVPDPIRREAQKILTRKEKQKKL